MYRTLQLLSSSIEYKGQFRSWAWVYYEVWDTSIFLFWRSFCTGAFVSSIPWEQHVWDVKANVLLHQFDDSYMSRFKRRSSTWDEESQWQLHQVQQVTLKIKFGGKVLCKHRSYYYLLSWVLVMPFMVSKKMEPLGKVDSTGVRIDVECQVLEWCFGMMKIWIIKKDRNLLNFDGEHGNGCMGLYTNVWSHLFQIFSALLEIWVYLKRNPFKVLKRHFYAWHSFKILTNYFTF